jgi:hypothetical protein
MVAFCGNTAQPNGVAADKHKPVINTVIGAFNQGFLMNVELFSNWTMTRGGIIMPGIAIPTDGDDDDV